MTTTTTTTPTTSAAPGGTPTGRPVRALRPSRAVPPVVLAAAFLRTPVRARSRA